MTAINQDSFPCNKSACYQPKLQDSSSENHTQAILKIPSHKRTCLLKRVFLSAAKNKKSMTFKEVIDVLCGEFAYFAEFKKRDRRLFLNIFQTAMHKYKNWFSYDKQSREWTLISPCTGKRKIDKRLKSCQVEDVKILNVPGNNPLYEHSQAPVTQETLSTKVLGIVETEMEVDDVDPKGSSHFDEGNQCIPQVTNNQGKSTANGSNSECSQSLNTETHDSERRSTRREVSRSTFAEEVLNKGEASSGDGETDNCETHSSGYSAGASPKNCKDIYKDDEFGKVQEMTVINQDSFPCNKSACYQPKLQDTPSENQTQAILNIPSNKRNCLLKKVFLSAAKNKKSMTFKEVIDVLCGEFAYFAEFRKRDRRLFLNIFQTALHKYKNWFSYDKHSREWSLISSCTDQRKINRRLKSRLIKDAKILKIKKKSTLDEPVTKETSSTKVVGIIETYLEEDVVDPKGSSKDADSEHINGSSSDDEGNRSIGTSIADGNDYLYQRRSTRRGSSRKTFAEKAFSDEDSYFTGDDDSDYNPDENEYDDDSGTDDSETDDCDTDDSIDSDYSTGASTKNNEDLDEDDDFYDSQELSETLATSNNFRKAKIVKNRLSTTEASDKDEEIEAMDVANMDCSQTLTTAKSQRPYPCRKKTCYNHNNNKAIPKFRSYTIPPHTKFCLIKRVISNATECDFAMTLREITKDICDEFPYYNKIREANKLDRCMNIFGNITMKNKHAFEIDKNTSKWSIKKTYIEGANQEASHQEMHTTPRKYPCNGKGCFPPNLEKSFQPKNCCFKCPPHSRICLVKRVLSSCNCAITTKAIVDDIVKEFPFYEEYRKYSGSRLSKHVGKTLRENRNIFKVEDYRWSLVTPANNLEKPIQKFRPFPCNERLGCKKATLEENGSSTEGKPPHKNACLLTRILLNAEEWNYKMTTAKIIEDLCEEFPYFMEWKVQDKSSLLRSYNVCLNINKHMFKCDKLILFWSLTKEYLQEICNAISEEGLYKERAENQAKNVMLPLQVTNDNQTSSKRSLYPCNKDACHEPDSSEKSRKFEIPKHSEACLMKKVFLDSAKRSLTSNEVMNLMCKEFAHYKEIRSRDKSTLHCTIHRALSENSQTFRQDQNNGKFYLIQSTTEDGVGRSADGSNRDSRLPALSLADRIESRDDDLRTPNSPSGQTLRTTLNENSQTFRQDHNNGKCSVIQSTKEIVLVRSDDGGNRDSRFPTLRSVDSIESRDNGDNRDPRSPNTPSGQTLRTADNIDNGDTRDSKPPNTPSAQILPDSDTHDEPLETIKGYDDSHDSDSSLDSELLNISDENLQSIKEELNFESENGSRIKSEDVIVLENPIEVILIDDDEGSCEVLTKSVGVKATDNIKKEVKLEANDNQLTSSSTASSSQELSRNESQGSLKKSQLIKEEIKMEVDDVKPVIEARSETVTDDPLQFFGQYINVIKDALMSLSVNAGTVEDIHATLTGNVKTRHISQSILNEFLRSHGTKYFQKFSITDDFELWTTHEDTNLKALILRFMNVFEVALSTIGIGSADEIYNFLKNNGKALPPSTVQRILELYGHEYLHSRRLGKKIIYSKSESSR